MKIVSAILNMIQKDKNTVTASELEKEDPENAQDILEANIIEYEKKNEG